MQPHKKNKYLLAILALFVIPLSGMGIDICVPSLPAVSYYFAIDKSLAQLTITTYILGFGIMQLFAGSLVDSYGRKKPFVIALCLYIIVTFLIPVSHNIYQLLLLRFLQGIIVGCLSVPMRAVISDLFEGQIFYKMMNYATMAWALGPIIAPAIGGYLQYYFGWHAPFYFLTIYGVIMLALNLIYMPETIKYKNQFQMTNILARYKQILLHREYLFCLVSLGLLYSTLILFGIIGPFLIQNILHYSAIAFGQMALLMGLTWFLGNMTNRFLINIDVMQKTKICFWLMLITTIIMLLVCINLKTNIYAIIIPTAILFYLGGIVFPNYFARSIALFPEAAATANSLMGAFMVLITAFSSGFATLLKSDTQIPLVLTYLGITLICLLTYYLNLNKTAGNITPPPLAN